MIGGFKCVSTCLNHKLMVLKLSPDLVVLWSLNQEKHGAASFNHVEWGLKQLFYREVLMGSTIHAWADKWCSKWLVDGCRGLSNIFGNHHHPLWESLLNNQCNGMTEGFELRTDGFWIKGGLYWNDWLGVRGLWTEPQLGYLWKLVFHGMALEVLKNVSHGKVGSKEQVHDLFSPFPLILNTTPNHGLVVGIYTYLGPLNGCV